LHNQIEGVNSFTSVLFDSPVDTDGDITSIIQTGELNVVDGGSDMPVGTDQPDGVKIIFIEPEPVEVEGEGGALQIQDNQTVVSVKINSVLTTNSISTVSKQITSVILPDVIQNTALSNINYFQVGAFLDAPLDAGDTIIYVGNTDKFSTNGYLLIGTEIVRYLRKINDRFLSVQRGQNNTTAQNWNAGTFLRQIPDPVSIAYAGVAIVESESQLVTVKGGIEVGRSEKVSNRQIVIQEDLSPEKDKLEFLVIPPPSGVVDGYQESAFISDPIKTRLNGFVDLTDDYGVVQRDGTVIFVRNSVFGLDSDYIGNYTKTNAGHTISHFSGIFDDGFANVSALTLQELETYYRSLTLKDFTERGDSSYTLAGDRFVLMPPSIQNPVAISSSSGTIGGNIVVQNTSYFPNEGYLFTSGGTVIQYTGKTSNQFTGCTLYRGPNSINASEELVPFTI